MEVNIYTIIISITIAVLTFAVTFYIKDYLQKRSDYNKLRKKLEKFAGKGANVLYSTGSGTGIGMGPKYLKLLITIKMALHLKTIFRQYLFLQENLFNRK